MEHSQIEACVDATAAMLGLPLAAEHRPGVLAYFSLAASMAALLMNEPLRLEDEPAAVFTPIGPSDLPRREARMRADRPAA